jgi:hypothetical protein
MYIFFIITIFYSSILAKEMMGSASSSSSSSLTSTSVSVARTPPLCRRPYATRFVSAQMGALMNQLCESMRKSNPSSTFTDVELDQLVNVVLHTGRRPLVQSSKVDKDQVRQWIERHLFSMSMDVAEVRTGRSTGYRAPELQDRGNDCLQAALWLAEDIEHMLREGRSEVKPHESYNADTDNMEDEDTATDKDASTKTPNQNVKQVRFTEQS